MYIYPARPYQPQTKTHTMFFYVVGFIFRSTSCCVSAAAVLAREPRARHKRFVPVLPCQGLASALRQTPQYYIIYIS